MKNNGKEMKMFQKYGKYNNATSVLQILTKFTLKKRRIHQGENLKSLICKEGKRVFF
jgi:hypothetical protein